MESVVEIISVISGKDRGKLAPDVSLRALGITSSIEILKIQSALERKFSQKLPPLGDTWTIDKIAAQVGGSQTGSVSTATLTKPTVEPRPAKATAGANVGSIFIGVDIEEIEHLPETSNYRDHDFYRSVFHDSEISYALLKPEPRIHLCGIFCAKEALKKSAVELIELRMDEIQVHHRQGRPSITTVHDSINSRFTFQVSISHSSCYAVANVLAIAE
ncbi:4'-phosphopantetheinyl transferase superfamily protein [Leptolyngbya sp. AN02str]|uniref:4'-phosphopantetheinyl transferase superfamily protein n=1 Tax=Leptolyngbya sp. AN02str TaxID=3423363 RepID=UPI003D318008